MKLSKILILSLNMLLHSKLRSWLTILGIFIGVTAVVAIISLGQELQQSVNSQIQGLGQDIITISSGSSRAGFGEGGGSRSSVNIKQLSDKDIQTLKLVPGIKYITGTISGRANVRYQSENTSVSIQGYDPTLFKEFVTTSIEYGRSLGPGDVKSIVIGNGLANNVFRSPLNVGYLISINDKPFRIVGILSSSSGLGGGGSENGIYMSTKDARDVLSDTTTLAQNEFSSIIVNVNDPQFVNETSNNIENALINSHHVTKNKEDFSISSALALQERFSSITSGVTLFLGVIAAVSLLVGSIGVANTMFTSVLEKVKDIGVMKAIGAKNRDILLLFLFNSGMLGLVGGILGVAGGVIISILLPYFGVSLGFGPGRGGLQTVINPTLLIFSLVFSIAIGMVSGAFPAYRASKLKPVESLRYE